MTEHQDTVLAGDAEVLPDRPEDDFVDVEGPGQESSRSRRFRLHCFHCNRPEGHFVKYRERTIYSFFVGLTFGLIYFVGPFRCQCCGHSRLLRVDFVHPILWARAFSNRDRNSGRRKRSRRRKH